jgi:serine/threonine protein kinase
MFEDDKYILIIMEYINGGNLFSFVKKRRKLSEKIAKFLFRQIILGIKHIHSKNIVHRDIKLENILIDLNNRVKICDFGIGVILRSEDELLYDQCGTPMYMAPEIILSSKKKGYRGFPVDIWSSGIALYIMLSGTLPFNIKNKSKKERKNMKNSGNSENGENYEENDDISLSNNNNYELQYSIINKNPKTIEKISDEARDILRGLLNKDPDKRLTIDEILNHPWLKSEENDYNYNKNKYKLFTKAEMIMLSKNYIDYRIKGNDDLKETFTLSNLNDSNEDNKNKNIKTKSSLLAPYNTLIENESCRINEDGDVEFDNGELFSDFNNSKIQLENEIIKMGNKVKQLYINYELNNNGELDNGMIIQSKSKSNTFNLSINDSDTNGNHSGDENIKFEDFQKNEEKKKEKILDIIEDLGYNKKYVLDCVENNKLCHASSVYYLLMNYENI